MTSRSHLRDGVALRWSCLVADFSLLPLYLSRVILGREGTRHLVGEIFNHDAVIANATTVPLLQERLVGEGLGGRKRRTNDLNGVVIDQDRLSSNALVCDWLMLARVASLTDSQIRSRASIGSSEHLGVTVDELVTSDAQTTLVLRHVHHRDGTLVNKVVLQGSERARSRSNHAVSIVAAILLVLDLGAIHAVVVVQALENSRGSH